MTRTVILITGANRGLGNGLLRLYLLRPQHTLIAATRDPGNPSSAALLSLPRAKDTTLTLAKIEATSPTDPTSAVQELTAQGVEHIDILIANAGICLGFEKAHFDVNVYGFVRLYQAFRALLQKAKAPNWSSSHNPSPNRCASSYLPRNFIPFPNALYAPSKLVVHWYTKAISVEDPWLTALVVDPGWVATDIGNRGANLVGLESAPARVEDSAAGVMTLIDGVSKETHSGRLFRLDGREGAW
ncbi:hypothetical protein BDW74DRAFT_170126 [Aspergillus multicolor]|uniref:uncharacterized protein n=1 Tax=Aspergillus multicolor TaxID=41759 RepID=UPI003CCCBAE6